MEDGDRNANLGQLATWLNNFYLGEENTFGSRESDQIRSLNVDEKIWARDGNDKVYAGDGNDQVWGENGDDRLYGGNGDDRLEGGDGNDTLVGGAGNDKLSGGDGEDLLADQQALEERLGRIQIRSPVAEKKGSRLTFQHSRNIRPLLPVLISGSMESLKYIEPGPFSLTFATWFPMYATLNLIRSLMLLILALASITGMAVGSERPSPDVRALLFYDPGSSQSGELFAFYLPGLYERYGARLQVSGIDVSQPTGKRAYRATAERTRLPPQPNGEPVVVVGDTAIVGLMAIATTLGDDFENLAKEPNANRWPPVPTLEELLPTGVEDIKARVVSQGVPLNGDGGMQSSSGTLPTSDQIANGLAVVVLLAMVLALIHSLVRLRRRDGETGRVATEALLLTSLVGFGISGYTAYTALADVVPMCGPIGGCAAVQESEYAKLFGIPMGVLGLVGYAIILVTWLIARFRSPRGGGWYWIPWTVALFGVLFSLRLTALEPFVIGATCLWCLGSSVSITIVLWLLSGYTRKGERPF